jgi:hypothetical protein
MNQTSSSWREKKRRGDSKAQSDTHIYILSLAFALLFHNKYQYPTLFFFIALALSIYNKQIRLRIFPVDKIRKYLTDYHNNPPNFISFMTPIGSMSGRLHGEFVWLLFLQTHRETDRFCTPSGIQLTEPTSGQFHFNRTVFSTHLRSKVDNILTNVAGLRITLNIDGTPILSRSHTHPSHS